jgi:Predicted transmembrane transcriptional regulator (anti-sigma factor)
MSTHQHMEQRLWEYIDGACTPEEKLFVKQFIASHPEWRAKYNELLELNTLMHQHLELDQPSLRFTQNVMEEISKYHIAPATKTYINKNIIRGISAFLVCTVVAFLVYTLTQFNWTATGNEAPQLHLGKIYNSPLATVCMMINVVLGLVLLDLYLSRKKKRSAA